MTEIESAPSSQTMKRCASCETDLPETAFYRRASGAVVLPCKACSLAANKAWVANNPERARANRRRCENALRRTDPEKHWLNSIRARAKAKGLAFDLTLEDIPVPSHCPVLGIPLRRRLGEGGSKTFHADSPSLDRIDNTGGYVRGNVVVVSNRVNRIKHTATVEELEAIARFYRSLVPG